MEQVVAFLRTISIFNRLTPRFLEHLAACLKVKKLPFGKTLLEAGSVNNHLIIVLNGNVTISSVSDRGPVSEYGGPGTILGVLGLLGEYTAAYTVRTEVENTIVLTLKRQDFRSILKAHPEEAILLIEALSGHLYKARVNMDAVAPAANTHQGTAQADEKSTVVVTKESRAGSEKKTEDNAFYSKRFTCACCKTTFTSLVVKSKYVRLEKTDSDFCPHYSTLNPLFYEVKVCPQCGYAFADETSVKLGDRALANLAERLLEIRPSLRFGEERDLEMAVESFHLASSCLEAIGGKKSHMGKLYLKIAWLYRSAGYEAQEREYCEKALGYFNESYRTEQSTDPAFELNLLYLLGDLNHRLGHFDLASQWFSRVLTHPRRSTNPNIVNRTRDQWYDLRKELKNCSEQSM